jgi:toxin ParE1/3/4
MSPRYRLTEQAREDVLDIWQYIAADNPDAADRIIDQFTATYGSLARSPRIGMDLSRLRSGLRAYPVGKYVIFFRPTEGGIEIYRVMHGARDWQSLLGEADDT